MRHPGGAVLLVILLCAAACSSTSTVSTPAVTTEATASQDTPGQGSTSDEAAALAGRLVTRLGSDDAGVDALLRAFERGYGRDQVVAGVRDSTLESDGMIAGVTPAFAPLGIIRLTSTGWQTGDEPELSTLAFRTGGRRAIGFTVWQEAELLPIEALRGEVKAASIGLDLSDIDEVVSNAGASATYIILFYLVESGLPPEVVIELIILGETTYTENGVCTRYTLADFENFRFCPPEDSETDAAQDSGEDAEGGEDATGPDEVTENVAAFCGIYGDLIVLVDDRIQAYEAAVSADDGSASAIAVELEASMDALYAQLASVAPEDIAPQLGLIVAGSVSGSFTTPTFGTDKPEVEAAIVRVDDFTDATCGISIGFGATE